MCMNIFLILVPEYHINDADIYAAMEAMEATKTSMDPYNNVLWSEGDQIVAFMTASSIRSRNNM